MAELPATASDAHLLHVPDVQKHWLLHFVGLMPVSAYSLRKALIEAHRLTSTGHVVQRIIASTGEIIIGPEQIARLTGRLGIGP